MRVSVATMILAFAATLLLPGWPTASAQTAEPCACPTDGCAVDDTMCQEQEPCADEQPMLGMAANVFGRFLNPGECDPHWNFTADVVALQRSSSRSQPLFETLSTNTPQMFDANRLDFPVEMGLQASAIRSGPCGWQVEVGYFQIDGWAANVSAPGTSLMITSAGDEGYFVTNGQGRYTSALHAGEINLRREWFDGLTLLTGFRMAELDELYSAYGIGARSPVPISLNTNTFNHLYGFQVGADWEFYNMGGPLRISALCKSGIYGNSAVQSSRQIETGMSDQTLDSFRNQVAFMGEAGAVATYQVTCHLSLRASCQAVWIEGVALAPEQIGATDFVGGAATIDTHGGIFYYGGGLGAELKF